MPEKLLSQYDHIVAIGGGHGLGRVLSSLSFLGPKLTGIVATTDNGGSTGRLRQSQDCIAWGDLRYCLSQLVDKPSVGSLLFDYRYAGSSELAGHNLGNLMLLALDQLCVRPLEAVNLIRQMLNVECQLIPMSEQPTHLVAIAGAGTKIYGEVEVDEMQQAPVALALEPNVESTNEAVDAIKQAELIILGPGSFLTSVMPPLLLPDICQAIVASDAPIIYVDNLTQEPSAAANFSIKERLQWFSQILSGKNIDAVLANGSETSREGNVFTAPLVSKDHLAMHDKLALVKGFAQILNQIK
ncbi:uridine diphosphate-N-acetylglucosamine-binding protein YvcK [Shewanella waksmanii]|uniref:uridine diphosphate-N-acetylglucosamine-binding protein YvcK n=1 Tax=Shewanella waksmanii TaxID=213783 RepID=UPI003736E708